MDNNDRRHLDILELIGNQRRDFQLFENSVLRSQAEHWKSVTIAIRTLTDWWVQHADAETAARIRGQRIRLAVDISIIAAAVIALALRVGA